MDNKISEKSGIQIERERLDLLIKCLSKRNMAQTILKRRGTDNYEFKYVLLAEDLRIANSIVGHSDNPGIPATMEDLEKKMGERAIPISIDHEFLLNELVRINSILKDSTQIKNAISLAESLQDLIELYQNRSHKIETAISEFLICPWWMASTRRKLRKELKDLLKPTEDYEALFKTVLTKYESL